MAIFQGLHPLTNTSNGNSYITEINQDQPLKLWVGSCEEYESLETIEDNIIYITTDGDPASKIDNDYMLKSVYDKNNLQIDIYEYINHQFDMYGGSLYDAVINDTNSSSVYLQRGNYELIKAKITNNEPVLILCTEITTSNAYSLRSAPVSIIRNYIAEQVMMAVDNDGIEYIRIGSTYRHYMWYSDNAIGRYVEMGENG